MPKQNSVPKLATIRFSLRITDNDRAERMRKLHEAERMISKLYDAELAAALGSLSECYAEHAKTTTDSKKRAELKLRARCCKRASRIAAEGAV